MAFGAIALAAAVALLWLGLGMTFFSDEWAFIEQRSLGDPASWFAPHNEHRVTFPVLLYRAVVETIRIGLRALPPRADRAASRRGVPGVPPHGALCRSAVRQAIAATIVLFLGGGFENLYWAFQISFVGPTLLGLRLEVTDGPARPGRAWLAMLLLASLATSGVGVVMAIAVGVEWLVDRRWRSYVPYLVVPAAIFLVWYLTFGQHGVNPDRDPLSLAAIASIPRFVADGLATVLGVVAGVPPEAGLLVLFAVIVAVGTRHPRRLRSPRVVGIAVAIVAQYALAALIRAHPSMGRPSTRATFTHRPCSRSSRQACSSGASSARPWDASACSRRSGWPCGPRRR